MAIRPSIVRIPCASEEPRSKLRGIFKGKSHMGTTAPKPSRASLCSALREFALRLSGLDANKERKLQ